MPQSPPAAAAVRLPDYAAVRRWHFYAGLFCLPFVLWLSLTGAAYLFRPQVEALLDRPYGHVAGPGPRASAAAQAEAAVRAVPGSVLHRYQLPDTPDQAVQVIVGRGKREVRVYVHPQTRAVLRTINEDARPMNILFRLHGELLAGDAGSYLVELAASWTIVMIGTGLFLWWPRGGGMGGVVYPRFGARGRRFWRDLHAVTGFWVSAMALFLLVSGLPWAKSWGSYLRVVRAAVEGSPARQDWASGRGGELRARAIADAGTRAMLGEHAEHGGMAMAHPRASYAALDRVVATVQPLELAAPVLVAPPTGPGAPWTAKSDAANRPLRADLTVDGGSGAVLSRRDFGERRLMDRLVGWGIAIHEGQAFGWANVLLNLVTAAGLALLSVSSVVLWWRRKPTGLLGAPPARREVGATGLALTIVALGMLLPLFGVSALLVLLAERLVLRRLPGPCRWLGLRTA